MSNFVKVYDKEGNPREVRPRLAGELVLFKGFTHEPPQKRVQEKIQKKIKKEEVTTEKE